MFDKLTERLSRAVDALRGRGRLTEDNIAEYACAKCAWRCSRPTWRCRSSSASSTPSRRRALGAEVAHEPQPRAGLHRHPAPRARQRARAARGAGFALNVQPPLVVLLAGLQGAGKTTTAAKLARWLIETQRKRVLLVSTDVRRPAAILQLERLAGQVGAGFFPAAGGGSAPPAIARGRPGAGARAASTTR